jgi:hypothetical protein
MLLKRTEMVFNYRRADVCGQPASLLCTSAAALGVVWRSSYMPAERRDRPLQREAFINNVKFTPAS